MDVPDTNAIGLRDVGGDVFGHPIFVPALRVAAEAWVARHLLDLLEGDCSPLDGGCLGSVVTATVGKAVGISVAVALAVPVGIAATIGLTIVGETSGVAISGVVRVGIVVHW